MMRIGLIGDNFYLWGGGVDFITTILSSLIEYKDAELIVFIGKENRYFEILKQIKNYLVIEKLDYRKQQEYLTNRRNRFNNFLESIKMSCPKVEVVFYYFGKGQQENALQAALHDRNIDICFPIAGTMSKNFDVPWIGYVSDFQHKYIPEFFEELEIQNRDIAFKKSISESKYILVNSKSVKDDIDKFYPNHLSRILVLPFLPFYTLSEEKTVDIKKYKLPEKYFIISNQFWVHKSHITAFLALEEAYLDGFIDLHIVCTGLMEDYRNIEFIKELKCQIEKLQCKSNIHFVGHVPKNEQLAMLRESIALIQPTLFEGGPGGGATYNAISMGVPCILSDIPINREIQGYDNVFFFENRNPSSLYDKMLNQKLALVKKHNQLLELNSERKLSYGKFLFHYLQEVINNWYEF